METLRIAQVAPYLHPHVGGVESHVEGVASELARRGHEVEVLTSRLDGTAPSEERDGYLITRVPTSRILFSTPITPRLGEHLAAAPRDLVHAHSPPPLSSWYAARWARASNTPFALTYHCDLEIPRVGGGAIVETYRRTMGRAAVGAADAIIATTRTYAETSRSLWHRTDVEVVPNMVDTERFRPDAPATLDVRRRHRLGAGPIALFVGRLTHHKGVEEFLRAAEHTAPVVHLVVGDGPRREALEGMARDLPAGRVVFAGKVDARHLPSYYRAAAVGVLPSTSRLEAFGIAALECMASGRPVVVSDIPGVSEVLEPGVSGLVAEPLDARDLAEKIRRLALDEELAASMGKAARERVLKHFTLPRVADRLVEIYQRISRGGGHSKSGTVEADDRA
ncbi:MAG TPA: glycosyltransferase family 4 protein [Candidatus Thermoplasmatota archaeon]|nr:glycosyltransferase family 4 protein [Candidatus Thermoplasmatota archaeon]